MRKFAFVLIAAMAYLLSGCQTARTQPPANSKPAAAAQEGLATLKVVVNANNYAALGFTSVEEVRQATLGEPLQIFSVRLDALRKFTDKASPDKLLVDARRKLYPVSVGTRVATSIFVGHAHDGWRANELGNAAVAQLVARYRHGPDDFLVHVPALKSWLVAERIEGQLFLTPVMDDPRTGFQAGERLPATAAFLKLQAAAEGYNGLPQ
ncbi:hypothetical protein GCM10027321_24180 [Massilia terrae]|uniref:Uncharacterized protein n=1 Tax=Massilia terrae TaxID=1811224 RepID=A0ABT2CXN8_9BURK|nr:hypothetical protein [Massilia terrae]MCS0658727.1 hypothetical protein [Massilia terrae]